MYWGNVTKKESTQKPADSVPPTSFRDILSLTVNILKQELSQCGESELLTSGSILCPPASTIKSYTQQFLRCDDLDYVVQMREKHVEEHSKTQNVLVNTVVEDQAKYPFDRSFPMTEKQTIRKLMDNFGKLDNEKSKRRTKTNKKLLRGSRQEDWVDAIERNNINKRAMLEHLLMRLQREQQKEIKREVDLLDTSLSQKQRNRIAMNVSQDRAEAADWFVRILKGYGLITYSIEIYYLQFIENQTSGPSQIELTAMNKDFEIQEQHFVPLDFTNKYRSLSKRGVTRRTLLTNQIKYSHRKLNPLVVPGRPRTSPIQFGGWGKQMSLLGEKILSHPSLRTNLSYVDPKSTLSSGTVNGDYSLLFRRQL